MRKPKVRYWSMIQGGSVVCESARTLKGVLKKAKACEDSGGTFHQIFKVVEIKRKKPIDDN